MNKTNLEIRPYGYSQSIYISTYVLSYPEASGRDGQIWKLS